MVLVRAKLPALWITKLRLLVRPIHSTSPAVATDVMDTELVSTVTAPNADPNKLAMLLLAKAETYVAASLPYPSKNKTSVATTTEPEMTLVMVTVTALSTNAEIVCCITEMSCKAQTKLNGIQVAEQVIYTYRRP